MPDLRSCYFCGDPGDSLGTYAVIPPRLNPSEAEQRRVVLCSTCNEKLVRVMTPLVDRLDQSAPSETTGRESATSRPGASQSSVEETAGDGPGIGPAGSGITIESPGEEPTGPGGEDSETSTDPRREDADVDDTETGSGSDDPLEPSDADGAQESGETGAAAPREEPSADYRKVMRLLENREFPVPRADLEAVVTSAYDIDDDQCRRILDYAIERGVLVEEGATLDRA
jgi:hypothetical protein